MYFSVFFCLWGRSIKCDSIVNALVDGVHLCSNPESERKFTEASIQAVRKMIQENDDDYVFHVDRRNHLLAQLDERM